MFAQQLTPTTDDWQEQVAHLRAELEELMPQLVDAEAELAERLQVSRQTVNAVETEKYEPSLTLAFKIARLFGRRVEDIFEPPTINGEATS